MTPLNPPSLRILYTKLLESDKSPIQELSLRLERRRRPMSEEAVGTTEYDPDTYSKLIEEKERDLELVSKVGLDLLKQNQELKERNEFLQTNLDETSEVIIQLQHDLKTRNSLLQTLEEYEDDCYSISETGERIGIVEKLREKVTQLETENNQLRNETSKLRQKATENDDFSQDRISEIGRQLEIANFKISKLQAQISEKDKECNLQSEEMKRLLEDLSLARSREKLLNRSNEDLSREIAYALEKHEELKNEHLILQEMYVEIKSSLTEAEEELGGYRRNHKPHRSISIDSLYDSLASELETSDSGFNTTPVISSRLDSRRTAINEPCCMNLHEELEEPIELASHQVLHQYEIPSRAFRAYQRSLSADPHRRGVSIKQLPTALDSELQTQLPESVPGPSTSSALILEDQSIELAQKDDSDSHFIHRNGKVYCNTSCSPIRIPSPPPRNDRLLKVSQQGSPRLELNSEIECLHSSSSASYAPNSPASSYCHSLSSSDGASGESTNCELLANYEGRKLGEPGKPGTRDLEISLRRLNIRHQMARDYEKYRKSKGLLPAHYALFGWESSKKELIYQNSPISKYFRKTDELDRQQPLKKFAIYKNSGLKHGIQVAPLVKGIFHRNEATTAGQLLTTKDNNLRVPISTSISSFLSQQSYSDTSLFGLKPHWLVLKNLEPKAKKLFEDQPHVDLGISMSPSNVSSSICGSIIQRSAL